MEPFIALANYLKIRGLSKGPRETPNLRGRLGLGLKAGSNEDIKIGMLFLHNWVFP
jgi:hypothetical protein